MMAGMKDKNIFVALDLTEHSVKLQHYSNV